MTPRGRASEPPRAEAAETETAFLEGLAWSGSPRGPLTRRRPGVSAPSLPGHRGDRGDAPRWTIARRRARVQKRHRHGVGGRSRGSSLLLRALRREVGICAACDHGQVACPDCRPLRRRASVRLAGAKYQREGIGARKHAARQRKCAAKISAQIVTHHAFPVDAPSTMVAESSAPVLAPADLEDRDGAVADDAADRGQGAEAAGDELAGGRPAQGAPSSPASAPARPSDIARGGGAVERPAGARCDFCRGAPRGLARLRRVGRRLLAHRKPARPLRLRDPTDPRPPQPRRRR